MPFLPPAPSQYSTLERTAVCVVVLGILLLGGGEAAFAQYAEQTGADNPFDGLSVQATSNSVDAVVGDFNTDGAPDLLAFDGSSEQVFLNDGSGGLGVPSSRPDPFRNVATPVFSTRGRTFVRDVDADGDVDLVRFDYDGGGQGTLVFLENTDGETYEVRTGPDNPFDGIAVSGNPSSVDAVLGDFGGDPAPDLLVFDGSDERYFENDGTGAFQEKTGADNPFSGVDPAFHTKTTTLVRDFDADGDLDLASRDGTGGAANWRYVENDGGTYVARTSTANPLRTVEADATEGSVAATAGDFDLDEEVELLTVRNGQQRFYQRNSSGDFEDRTGSTSLFSAGMPFLQVKSNTVPRDVTVNRRTDLTFANPTADALRFARAPGPFVVTITGEAGTGNDAGFRMLAFPTPAQRSDLQDDFSFDFDALSSGAVVHTYDDDSYNALTQPSSPIERGFGAVVYFFDDADDPLTPEGISLDVVDRSASQTADVTVSGLAQSDEFELLGNPFDVEFALDALRQTSGNGGGSLFDAGFRDVVAVYNGDAQRFEFFVRGNGATIPAFNGFVLQRRTLGEGDTELTFPASGRGSTQGDVIGSASKAQRQVATLRVGLDVTGAQGRRTVSDRAVLRFDSRVAEGSDRFAFRDLPPPVTASGYATVGIPVDVGGSTRMRALTSRPYPETGSVEAVVPLRVRGVDFAGQATLRWPKSVRDEIPSTWQVVLEDRAAGERVDLRVTPEGYTFSLDASGPIDDPQAARFRLRVTSGEIPVELTQFQATTRSEAEAVALSWTTASETNNAGFTVERATETGAWTDVGFVDGAGTTQSATRYTFTDDEVPFTADSLRYRLRQTDVDGTTHLSEPTTVAFDAPKDHRLLAPFPNPVRQQVTVRYTLATETDVRLDVYDVLGRRIATVVNGRKEAGRKQTPVDVSGWASGTYFLRLQVDGQQMTQQVTVVQ